MTDDDLPDGVHMWTAGGGNLCEACAAKIARRGN